MAKGITYRPDRSAVRAIGVSGAVRSYLTVLAAAGVAAGKSAAPVASGRYRDGFRIAQATEVTRGGDPRAVVQVSNDAPHSLLVEYGTPDMPARDIMRGTVLSAIERAARG